MAIIFKGDYLKKEKIEKGDDMRIDARQWFVKTTGIMVMQLATVMAKITILLL